MGNNIKRGGKDGHAGGEGMPGGLGRNQNTEPCETGAGPGHGEGEGRGGGRGRRKSE